MKRFHFTSCVSPSSDSNSGSDSSSSSSQSDGAATKPVANNTSRGSKSDGDHVNKSDDSSPDGTDEDTRTGAITSNNAASQYHHDDNGNATDDSDQDDDSDALSNQSDNQAFSSSKSSIDVSLNRLAKPAELKKKSFFLFLGGRRGGRQAARP